MKLTKLMVLALVLVLFVCAFVACGGTTDTETQAPETQAPETQAPDSETEAPGEDTEAECAHEIVVDEKAATCSDRGYKKETCKLCGEVISETAYPKTAHTASGAATCDTDSKCTVCGEVLEAAKGHVWGEVTTTAATCTAAGKETKTCTVCNKTDVKELATLAHDIAEATEYVPATCTTEGSKTGVCSLCGQTQTVVLPAAHVVTDLGDLSALTFVDGKIQAKCTACEAVVDVTAEVRFALSFDEADVPTELAKYGDGFNYLLVYNGDQAGTVTDPNRHPAVTKYADATDGHTSVLTTKHNCSPAITFKGELLADADYYVISFDWRATKYGNNTNKIGAFGQAAKAFEGVAGEGDMVYAFKVDRSNGDLYDHSGKNKFGSAPAEQWYKVIVVVDNESGTAYTYVDGVCVATTQNAKWQVVEGGEYTWRFGGIYNVFHVPEFDNFEVVAIQKSVTEVGPSVDGGDEEEGDEEDDGTGCAHQCSLEYQLPTPTTPGFIKRTCLICGRVVTFEVLDHQCTPNVPADCVNSSYCTECGELIEAAWGHEMDPDVPVVETPADPACGEPGTRTGKCLTCGQDVVEDLEPAAHTFIVSSIDQLQLVDGEIKAVCSVCGQLEVVSESVLMAIDFESDVNSELAAHENANKYGFAYGTVYHYEKQAASPVCALAKVGQRTVLSVSPWASGRAGNHTPIIKFSGDMLGATSYYVVSFDVCFSGANDSDTPNYKGFFGLKKLASNTLPTGMYTLPTTVSDFALVADRTAKASANKSLGILNGATSARKDVVKNDWYSVTILVDNVTGKSTIYIDGTLLGVNDNNKMLVEGGQYYLWLFGTDYNNGQRAQFDSFKVYALGTECLHTDTSPVEVTPATCTAPGTGNKVCDKCGEVVGIETIPELPHEPGTVTNENFSACAYKADCALCGGNYAFAKDGATHTVTNFGNLNELTVVGDKVYGTCDVCGLVGECTADVRIKLDFDKATFATELETQGMVSAQQDASGKLTTTAFDIATADTRTVLSNPNNGRLFLKFDPAKLSDAEIYVISFDYRVTAFNASGSTAVSVIAVCNGEVDPTTNANSIGSYANVTKLNRPTETLTDGSTTEYKALTRNEWYTLTIVVDNVNGKANLYIDGEFAATISHTNFKMSDDVVRSFRLGEGYSTHKPQYDNFKVSVIK